ncbi:MAG: lysine exporter LysO family protein, partial [Anaerovoracaceae bacterium]
MTKKIILAVICGVLAGYFLLPSTYTEQYLWLSEKLLIVGLCFLLFFVGIDLGMDGSVVSNFKKVGWRIIIFPIAIVVGTLAATAVASLLLPISVREGMAVGAGFGWYSLAPVMLSKYSAELSAISFMHNVMREL